MADIEALLGIGADDPAADMRATARRLRGERDLGDFLSLSTVSRVADMGASRRKSAVRAAERLGQLRDTARSRAQRQRNADRTFQRLTERDAVADRQYEREWAREQARYDEERAVLGDPVTFVKPDGERVTLQQRADGRFVDNAGAVHDISSYVEAPRRGRRYTSGAAKPDGYGNRIVMGDAGPEFLDGTPWTMEEAISRGQDIDTLEAEGRGLGERAKLTEKERAEQIESSLEAESTFAQTRTELQNALQALEEGAWTGPVVSQYLPTLRASTARLENARDRLALTEIGNYTFGSLSEGEAAWLKGTSLNARQSPQALRAAIERRLEGIARLEAANRFARRAWRQGMDPEEIAERAREIKYRGGFTFSDPPLSAEARAGVTFDTAYPDATAEERRRFNALTPAAQQRILDAAGG